MGNGAPVDIAIISIVGLSGSGKTTLMEKLVRELTWRGHRIGTIKHSCHPHTMDAPGKDSWRHKEAGAERTIFIGPKSMQLVADVAEKTTPGDIAKEYLADLDIVLVEGFLHSETEKIEVVRSERSKEPILTPKEGLIAMVTDIPAPITNATKDTPCFALNDIKKVAGFIEKHFALRPAVKRA